MIVGSKLCVIRKWFDIDTSPDKLGDVSCWPYCTKLRLIYSVRSIGISIHPWIFQAEDKWSHDASVSSSTEIVMGCFSKISAASAGGETKKQKRVDYDVFWCSGECLIIVTMIPKVIMHSTAPRCLLLSTNCRTTACRRSMLVVHISGD